MIGIIILMGKPFTMTRIKNFFIFCKETQFRRCLDQHLGLRISDEDYKFLVDKYDVKGNGMVNYRNFSETLEKGGIVHQYTSVSLIK